MINLFKNKQNNVLSSNTNNISKKIRENYLTTSFINVNPFTINSTGSKAFPKKNERKNEYTNIVFYPFSSKEWFSSLYSYNKSYIKNTITYDVVLSKLINSYCNMLQNSIKTLFKRRRDNKIRYSANKIYVSKPELKHTNDKVVVTLYLYNKEKSSIEQYIRKVITLIKLKKQVVEGTAEFMPNHKNRLFYLLKNKIFVFKKWNMISFKPINNPVEYLLVGLRRRYLRLYNVVSYTTRHLKKIIKIQKILFNSTKSIHFNINKFNSSKLNLRNLGLIGLVRKLYNKKIVINLVELKSIHLNSYIFSSAVALKLRDRKNKVVRILRKAVLQMVRIPDLHTLITFDNTIEATNKYNIINTIKQQIVSGVRFEASGRLTRRLTAMRAVFKYRYAGSLKNIRSSFNNKSSTMLRGYVKSNSQYTLINSKTRNGTFGLKGWVSSH